MPHLDPDDLPRTVMTKRGTRRVFDIDVPLEALQ